jgi:microcystin degradation protein MlrC
LRQPKLTDETIQKVNAMRVGIVGLLHESNTFIPEPTGRDRFRQDMWLSGEEIRDRMGESNHELGGFFQGLDAAGVEAVPLWAFRAYPYGPVDQQTFQEMKQLLCDAVEAAEIDGLLVAVHGATVAEGTPDADGEVLTSLRRVLPAGCPLISTLDAHANVSSKMVTPCDAVLAYKTNPHIDQLVVGKQAAELMVQTLRGEVKPVVEIVQLPMVISIERQHTPEDHWKEIRAAIAATSGPILNKNVMLGFPYADVAEMGCAVLVVADGDRQAARLAAEELAEIVWQRRADFVGQLIEIDEAIDQALAAEGSSCLLDMGDNVGGGSPGDGTALAHAFLARQVKDSLVIIADDELVTTVVEAMAANDGNPLSVGDTIELSVGGKSLPIYGPPLRGKFELLGTYEGEFTDRRVRHGGFTHYDQGLSVVLRQGGLTILVTTRRIPPFSTGQLTACGLDPSDYRVMAAKGVHAPLAAYEEYCTHFHRVNTPGVTTADLSQLAFQHRRQPLYPFEIQTER